MEAYEYEKMNRLESDHWWYRGLHDFVLSNYKKKQKNLLDAGCGTGRLLELLANDDCVGIDFSQQALDFASSKVSNRLVQADIRKIPFADNSFDQVISCDVIDCLQGNDITVAFSELSRVLQPKGTLLLNLPANEWLKSEHDRAVHILHRFNRQELREYLEIAGFEVKFISYRNFFLFPLIVVVRLLKKPFTEKQSQSDVSMPSSFVNRFLEMILKVENRLIRKCISLPWGLSLVAKAVKK